MKRLIGTILLIASLAFVVQPTSALEGGYEDTDNPRVVYLYGCTGFLFAPRIVITAAHCDQVDRAMEPGLRTSWARTPDDSARVIEFFKHPDFKHRSPGYPEVFDFGVAILERPLAYVPEAKIIDEPTLLAMAEAREMVTFSGYGLQSLKDRVNSQKDPRNVFPRTTQFELIPKAEGEERIAKMVAHDSWLESYPEGLVMVNQPQLGAQTCDGDSGSGYYLRDGDSFTFVGVTNWPLGIRNCYVEDFTQSWYKGDATVGVFPAYNGLDVIQRARDYVAANPVAGEVLVSREKNNFVLPRFSGEPTALVKERIQKYAVANPKMTKFICTSVRLSSTPSRTAIAMRAQAKAVCDYAKKVNPDLKTWYQSKVSIKPTAVGMQLITVKFD
jgi:hypothetical protein